MIAEGHKWASMGRNVKTGRAHRIHVPMTTTESVPTRQSPRPCRVTVKSYCVHGPWVASAWKPGLSELPTPHGKARSSQLAPRKLSIQCSCREVLSQADVTLSPDLEAASPAPKTLSRGQLLGEGSPEPEGLMLYWR